MSWQAVWTNSLNALTEAQKEQNVDIIYYYFNALGWTIKPIAAMLGNIETESQLNPAQWEAGYPIYNPGTSGFGLVQWTPWTKLRDWLGTGWETNYTGQLQRIEWESQPENQGNVNPNGQWIPVYSKNGYVYGNYTFQQFAHDTTHAMDWLVGCFQDSYERPRDSSISSRTVKANRWLQYMQNHPPTPPTPVSTSKLKIWMMLKPYYRRY